jgi:formylglycine-generating enzyme required for sulfatase activity
MSSLGSLAVVLAMLVTAQARDTSVGRLTWARDVTAARARAKAERLPTLLYFTHDDSEPDAAFDRGALSDDAVVDLARGFACAVVNCTGASGFVRADAAALPTMESYRVGSFPTVVLITADGVRAGGHVGACDAETLKRCMRQALTPLGPSVRMDGLEFLGRNPSGQEEYRRSKDDGVMILVPGGEFSAGENDECHLRVDACLLDRTEVSNAQFDRFLEATHGTPPEPLFGKGWLAKDLPVTGTSWEQASAFSKWCGARLPSESEWEKAARGTDGRPYPWGKDRQPWIYLNEKDPLGGETNPPRPVGSTLWDISPYGLRDMGGNPGEWCVDEFRPDFYGKSHANPLTLHTEAATGHTVRSECMCNRRWCPHQVYARASGEQSNLKFNISFRCAVTVPERAWLRPAPGD